MGSWQHQSCLYNHSKLSPLKPWPWHAEQVHCPDPWHFWHLHIQHWSLHPLHTKYDLHILGDAPVKDSKRPFEIRCFLWNRLTTHYSCWMFCVAKWWWESHLFDLSMCELYWLLLLPPSMLETLFAAWRTGSAALFSLSGWTTPWPCMDSFIMLKLQNYLVKLWRPHHCADMSVILGTKHVATVH